MHSLNIKQIRMVRFAQHSKYTIKYVLKIVQYTGPYNTYNNGEERKQK